MDWLKLALEAKDLLPKKSKEKKAAEKKAKKQQKKDARLARKLEKKQQKKAARAARKPKKAPSPARQKAEALHAEYKKGREAYGRGKSIYDNVMPYKPLVPMVWKALHGEKVGKE